MSMIAVLAEPFRFDFMITALIIAALVAVPAAMLS